MTVTALTLAGGSWTFAAFIAFMFVAFTYATYTRGGQGIGFHPYSRSNTDAPGATRPSAVSGREGIAAMTSRGTR
jgi:hypothetical protein